MTLIKRRFPNELFVGAWGIWYFLQLVFVVVAPACAGAIFDFTKSYPFMLLIAIGILAIPLSLVLLLARRGGTYIITATRMTYGELSKSSPV